MLSTRELLIGGFLKVGGILPLEFAFGLRNSTYKLMRENYEKWCWN